MLRERGLFRELLQGMFHLALIVAAIVYFVQAPEQAATIVRGFFEAFVLFFQALAAG